ncbi:MAG: site-specific integrase [Fimbriimonadaceae bacterium]|nr:site-specific integrase [Fimbriimonadaceae bacterium]
MPGRPQLRIGAHGKITRIYQGDGVWLARCRYRDLDGVTRVVQRVGPADDYDKHGKLAQDALIEALNERRRLAISGEVTTETKVYDLVERHLTRLEENGRSPATMSTYRYNATKLKNFIGGLRVGEATAARIDAAIRSMNKAHGPTMARQSKTILAGALQLAVMANALTTNPTRDVESIERKKRPQGAPALDAKQVRDLRFKLAESEYCRELDLADPVLVLMATGLRRSELLALRWEDFDEEKATLSVAGKVVRAKGEGLKRLPEPKTDAGYRTVPLPKFAVTALKARRSRPFLGEQWVIFPSTAGTLRDPNNFGKQWRKVRDELGAPDVSSHSFRKTIATLIDEEGLSARVGADQLGHSNVSMTQDRYMKRGTTHTEVAALMDRTVGINDE